MNQHVQRLWEAYRQHVVAANADQVQVEETRRAFFAGAVALFSLVTGGLSPESEPTQKDLDLMSAIAAELDAFNVTQGVATGRLVGR